MNEFSVDPDRIDRVYSKPAWDEQHFTCTAGCGRTLPNSERARPGRRACKECWRKYRRKYEYRTAEAKAIYRKRHVDKRRRNQEIKDQTLLRIAREQPDYFNRVLAEETAKVTARFGPEGSSKIEH